ncbi:CPBP family intramembrane metalloprotease [Paenibacillus sp. TRM 82003]|uniref:CPBP family intramembrane glutamic endopeptidase n=1 Tax=Kineococcus sp. TRM81007 TaxID=2925831 RepID=UPI001F599FC4|nr:CPBP family intramembrane glutamic endopeptidase [Kineococcus sp. TRM81007]MCI2238725.1 CPBP family intramembrane metalloprotease [Kineococcus sp. TRM81007]MCI3924131.1 CPBP family intramembrane metalloprotease [Paenibacillus sp. TRM 82003]
MIDTPLAPGTAPSPVPYTAALRGPRHRWWRPLVGAAVVAGGLLVLVLLTGVGYGVAWLVTDLDGAALDEALFSTWWGLLLSNLVLAAGVPLAWLAVRAGHGRSAGLVSSVAGRWRWRWALRVLPPVLAVAVVAALAMAVAEVLAGRPAFGDGTAPAAGRAVALLAVVLLTTPLQAAGEEYFFRGWLSQALGSWCARPVVGAVLAAVVSAVLFGAAHGPQDPWLFTDRLVFALVASWLVHRTGGLEAAVVLHAVNNVVVMVPAVLTGALAQAIAETGAPPLLVVLDVAGMLAAAAAVDARARRRERARR